jgi:hypothetical protein
MPESLRRVADVTLPMDEAGSGRIPVIPLNVRLRHHQGRDLAIGYEHSMELSHSAVFIWKQIDGTATVGDIARALSAEYDIEFVAALEDTSALFDDLVSHQLVAWASART